MADELTPLAERVSALEARPALVTASADVTDLSHQISFTSDLVTALFARMKSVEEKLDGLTLADIVAAVKGSK